MSLNVNLLELVLDPSVEVTIYRRSYDDISVLDEIREQLDAEQFVTRLGDEIWGYSLPETMAEQYKFAEITQLASVVEPRFMNSLLRHAIRQRLEQLGFRRAGFDRYERSDDVAFALGDKSELVARPRWLVRPFSLPSGGSNTYALLANPRLAYKFKVDLAQLSEADLHWNYVGAKVRAVTADQSSQEDDLWETAHTALVVEDRGMDGLLCTWRNGEQQRVSLTRCWLLASTENRYRYLRLRYPGPKGERLTETMRNKDNDFFALEKVRPRIERLGQLIGQIRIGYEIDIPVGSFIELAVVSRERAEELQASMPPAEISIDESVGEDDEDEEDLEEFVQLELF